MFLFGCIFTRILITILTKNTSEENLPSIGYIGLIISLGFFYVFFIGSDIADN